MIKKGTKVKILEKIKKEGKIIEIDRKTTEPKVME